MLRTRDAIDTHQAGGARPGRNTQVVEESGGDGPKPPPPIGQCRCSSSCARLISASDFGATGTSLVNADTPATTGFDGV